MDTSITVRGRCGRLNRPVVSVVEQPAEGVDVLLVTHDGDIRIELTYNSARALLREVATVLGIAP